MLKEIMLTTDLKMLIATATLALVSFMPYFMAYIKCWGITGIVGNRDNLPELPPWAQRALAAHANLTENLVHFAVLVLVAHVTAANNDITAMGATLFFWARIAYLVIYIAGIPWLRTVAFMAGWVGEVMILIQLF
ncbi:MAPEG family protein [Kaarinaea lacus]